MLDVLDELFEAKVRSRQREPLLITRDPYRMWNLFILFKYDLRPKDKQYS